MATIAKKRKTTRRPGASKAPAKRKKKVAGVAGMTKKIAGVNFKKSSCHKSKSEAVKSAEAARDKGAKARVIKSGTAYCVYKRGGTARKRA